MGRLGQRLPIRDETSQGEPLPLLPHARKIAPLLNPSRAPETQALWRFTGLERLDRRQTLTPDAPAVAQDRAAAFAGITAQKPVLAFAADF